MPAAIVDQSASTAEPRRRQQAVGRNRSPQWGFTSGAAWAVHPGIGSWAARPDCGRRARQHVGSVDGDHLAFFAARFARNRASHPCQVPHHIMLPDRPPMAASSSPSISLLSRSRIRGGCGSSAEFIDDRHRVLACRWPAGPAPAWRANAAVHELAGVLPSAVGGAAVVAAVGAGLEFRQGWPKFHSVGAGGSALGQG